MTVDFALILIVGGTLLMFFYHASAANKCWRHEAVGYPGASVCLCVCESVSSFFTFIYF